VACPWASVKDDQGDAVGRLQVANDSVPCEGGLSGTFDVKFHCPSCHGNVRGLGRRVFVIRDGKTGLG
jgi:hypothetical protein